MKQKKYFLIFFSLIFLAGLYAVSPKTAMASCAPVVVGNPSYHPVDDATITSVSPSNGDVFTDPSSITVRITGTTAYVCTGTGVGFGQRFTQVRWAISGPASANNFWDAPQDWSNQIAGAPKDYDQSWTLDASLWPAGNYTLEAIAMNEVSEPSQGAGRDVKTTSFSIRRTATCTINSFTYAYQGGNKYRLNWKVAGSSLVDISGVGSSLSAEGSAENVGPGTYTLTAQGCSSSSLTLPSKPLDSRVRALYAGTSSLITQSQAGLNNQDVSNSANVSYGSGYDVQYYSQALSDDPVNVNCNKTSSDNRSNLIGSGGYSMTCNRTFQNVSEAVTATVNITEQAARVPSLTIEPVNACGTTGIATLHIISEDYAYQVRVNNPTTGNIFTSGNATGATGDTATTGKWVTDGMKFYLVKISTDTVLAQATASVINVCGYTATPSKIIMSAVKNGPLPQAQTINVNNTSPLGQPALTINISKTATVNWANLDKSVTVLDPGDSDMITVTANTTNLNPGKYTAYVNFANAEAGNKQVEVEYNITEQACADGSVSLSSASINVGQASSASAPAGWSNGSFSSSNASVASVSGLTITGVSAGTANISGSGWKDPNGTANCPLNPSTVTVNAPPTGCTVTKFEAKPNPILTCNSTGVTTINADASCDYDIRVSSTNGQLFAQGKGALSQATGNWVDNGTKFYLQKRGDVSSSGTLGVITVGLSCSNNPTCTLTASPSSGTAPLSGTLSWNSQNSTFCRGDWTTGDLPTSKSGLGFGPINSNRTYVLTCYDGSGKSGSCNAPVSVSAGAGLTCSANSPSVAVNQAITFTAANNGCGSNPSDASCLNWTGGGVLTYSNGTQNYTTAYNTTGVKTVSVRNNSKTAACSVNVTNQPLQLSCSPNVTSIPVGQPVTFTASNTGCSNGTCLVWWASFSTPAGSVSTPTFTTRFNTAGVQTVNVSNGNGQTTCSVTVTATPDISVSAAPKYVESSPGLTASYLVTVQSKNGFAGIVDLSHSAASLCSAANASCSWPSGTKVTLIANGSASLPFTVALASGAATNLYDIKFTGTSGSLKSEDTSQLMVLGSKSAVCDNQWHQVPGNGQTDTQPATLYLESWWNGRPGGDRRGAGSYYGGSVAVSMTGKDRRTYMQDCMYGYHGLNNPPVCNWENSWQAIDATWAAYPGVKKTEYSTGAFRGDAWDVWIFAEDNRAYYNINWSHLPAPGWTGWKDMGTVSYQPLGTPFRATDANNNIWQFRSNSDSSISYNCGPNPVCVDLPFNSSRSGISPSSVQEGKNFTVVCDYNSVNDTTAKSASTPAGICSFARAEGTKMIFNCEAEKVGTFDVSCKVDSGTADNVCEETNKIGQIVVSGSSISDPVSVKAISSSCGKISVSWTPGSNSSGLAGFNVYRSSSNNPYDWKQVSQTFGPSDLSFDDNAPLNPGGDNWYAVEAFTATGKSQKSVSNNGLGMTPSVCQANLTGSDKDIVKVNNKSFANTACNGQTETAVINSTSFMAGDKVRFAINVCNDKNGTGDATDIVVTDQLYILRKSRVSKTWSATFDGVAIPDSDIKVSGTEPNQVLEFGPFNIVAGKSKTLEFDAEIAPNYPRFQNSVRVDYNSPFSPVRFSTPSILINQKSGSPTIIER